MTGWRKALQPLEKAPVLNAPGIEIKRAPKEKNKIGRDVPRLALFQTFKLLHQGTLIDLHPFALLEDPLLSSQVLLLYLSQNSINTELASLPAFNRESPGSRLEGWWCIIAYRILRIGSKILRVHHGESTLCRHRKLSQYGWTVQSIPFYPWRQLMVSLAWLVAGHLEIASARTLFPGTRALPTCMSQVGSLDLPQFLKGKKLGNLEKTWSFGHHFTDNWLNVGISKPPVFSGWLSRTDLVSTDKALALWCIVSRTGLVYKLQYGILWYTCHEP